MATKADLNPKSHKFDWRKSPAHLVFLATFIQPHIPDKHPTDTPWPLILGEPPEKAVERFQKEGVLISCTTSQILAHELPKLTVKRLRELSLELALPVKVKDKKDVLVQRLVQNRHPGLLLSVPNRYLVHCSDEGHSLVEQFLARGGEILEGTDEPTARAIKETLFSVYKKEIVAGILSAAAYDLIKLMFPLLKQWFSPEELKDLPPLPTETPSPQPLPTPPQKTTPPPKETPIPTPRRSFEPEMVHIPAGYFWMGKDEFDPDAREREKPRHRVYLSEYWIGKYPVTNREYQFFVRETGHRAPHGWNGSQYPEGKGYHPVAWVYWGDANTYCQWLARKTGKPFRLPTEAEWEKAASWDAGVGGEGSGGVRGKKRLYPWGDEWDAAKCNSKEGGAGNTTPVRQYSTAGDSPYGCADMAGNVWEWCSDWWDEKEYARRRGQTVKDPQGPEKGDWHVARGGSYYNDKNWAASASRVGYLDLFYDLFGFWVAASPGSL